ncbi:MAG: GatB/YqeY domain-containing protein [Chloroflexi bacterium]|nr:GatB/YqeY domain-containing protein [Chloroflexota bacterium]
MGLQERLVNDLRDAMRSNDGLRKDAIRMVRAALQNAEIEAHQPLDDTQIEQIISRDIKRRQESIELLRQAKRPELIKIEESSIALLQAYLPEMMSREQVEAAVCAVIARVGATSTAQMGAVMREAMAELKGRADGRLVNEVVRAQLSR